MENFEELTLDMIGNADTTSTEETIENISTEGLFNDTPEKEEVAEDSEGVSGEDQEVNEDVTTDDGSGSSPNFYASIAKSLHGDGILTLDEESIGKITDADTLAEAFNNQVKSLLDETTTRVSDALKNNVPNDTIRQFEGVLQYLSTLTDEQLKAETEEGETIRYNILYQDYINKGFTPERAEKEIKKSFDAGTDVEDALEAKVENANYFKSEYSKILNVYKQDKENRLKQEKDNASKLEKKILDTEEPIKGLKLSKQERTQVLNNLNKVVDKEGNIPLNALQKYARENPIDYQYNLNLLFSLTDGFKDLSKLIGKEVTTRTKSKIADLEHVLKRSNPTFDSGGFSFGNSDDPESKKGIMIDL